MAQLEILKSLLGNQLESDAVLQFYLDSASAIICDRRNTDVVEPIYSTLQIKMAIELYNKRGAEGQSGHSENGISRTYESSDLSPSLLAQVTPIVKTPFSAIRVVMIP